MKQKYVAEYVAKFIALVSVLLFVVSSASCVDTAKQPVHIEVAARFCD